MDLTKEKEQRAEFKSILFELAKSQEELKNTYCRINLYKRLEELYDAPETELRFRHFYSDIFSVLTQIQQDTSLGDINILGQNLEIIRKGYQPNKNKAEDGHSIDVTDPINKLYDHVSLDIARIAYTNAGDWKLSGEEHLKNLDGQVNEVAEKINQVQINAEAKISNQQKEYISILGIFAAVVLAFTGGIAFSTSVVNNIANVSAYRIIAIALIIGIVLVNVVYGLFYYLDKIVSIDKNEKLKPLIISNLVLVGLLLVLAICWNCGVIESRNRNIEMIEVHQSQQLD